MFYSGDIGVHAYEQWQSWRGPVAPDAFDADDTAAAAIVCARARAAEPPAIMPPGCVDLDQFVVLALEGSDARRFLQGYVTCDVDALTPSTALIGAFTNLQGRVVGDLMLFEIGDLLTFVVHRSIVQLLRDGLKKYLMFSKAKLIDLSDRFLVLGSIAPDRAQTSMPIPESPLTISDWQGGRVIREPGMIARLRLVLPLASAQTSWAQCRQRNEIRSSTLWQLIDIASGIAHVESGTANQFLPQMLDLDRQGAISFTKGCYLGQEIVARAQHRGQVKRRLVQLAWRGAARPQTGASLQDAGGRTRATLVSAAPCARNDTQWHGLALAVGSDVHEPLSADDVTFEPF
jgi:tRNA-modifying protein YgfZ